MLCFKSSCAQHRGGWKYRGRRGDLDMFTKILGGGPPTLLQIIMWRKNYIYLIFYCKFRRRLRLRCRRYHRRRRRRRRRWLTRRRDRPTDRPTDVLRIDQRQSRNPIASPPSLSSRRRDRLDPHHAFIDGIIVIIVVDDDVVDVVVIQGGGRW